MQQNTWTISEADLVAICKMLPNLSAAGRAASMVTGMPLFEARDWILDRVKDPDGNWPKVWVSARA